MKNSPRVFNRSGFTIIELLAATAVFALMMVFTAQMVGRTTQIASQTSKQIESTSGTQTGMDALTRDLRNMVRTQGFTLIYGASGGADSGSDRLTFLSMGRPRSSGGAIAPRYIAVQYQVGIAGTPTSSGNLGHYSLIRIEKPVAWDQNSKEQLQALADDTSPASTDDTDVISERIIRMEIVFVWKDGSISTDIPNDSYHRDARYTVQAANLANLSAIVVGMVSMDEKSQDLLEPNGVAGLAGQFESVANDNEMPLQRWSMNETAALQTVYKTTRSGIRYFQRVIPIN